MGGQRFQGMNAIRINAATHDALATRIIGDLTNIGIEAETLPYVRSKNDFGDIDLICRRSQMHDDNAHQNDAERRIALQNQKDRLAAVTARAKKYERPHLSDPVLGMLIETPEGLVHVDLISIPDERYDFVKAQLSWGDAGSLASVIAKQMGIKMGMNGAQLSVPGRRGNLLAPLSATHEAMLELIGLDATRHAEGFDTNADIYQWLADGLKFDPRIWQLDWLTNKARARATKRPAYMEWLEWLELNEPKPTFHWGDRRGARAEEFLPRLYHMFPRAKDIIEDQMKDEGEQEMLAGFFNGNIVRQVSGVEGEALGHLMNAVRRRLGEETLMAMAKEHDNETLTKTVLEIMQEDYLPEGVVISK